jgi:hypothetical protein
VNKIDALGTRAVKEKKIKDAFHLEILVYSNEKASSFLLFVLQNIIFMINNGNIGYSGCIR